MEFNFSVADDLGGNQLFLVLGDGLTAYATFGLYGADPLPLPGLASVILTDFVGGSAGAGNVPVALGTPHNGLLLFDGTDVALWIDGNLVVTLLSPLFPPVPGLTPGVQIFAGNPATSPSVDWWSFTQP